MFRIFLCVLVVSVPFMGECHEVKYQHFDDYLNSLGLNEQAKLTGDSSDIEGSGELDSELPLQADEQVTSRPLPIRTGLTRSKDVACCALGQLAGDKGYHCFVKFYKNRIMLRNKNRAHNRKMGFHGKYRVPNYGTKLMQTFEQCVAGRGMIFHKCCQMSTIARKSHPHYDSWQRQKYDMKHQQKKYQKAL